MLVDRHYFNTFFAKLFYKIITFIIIFCWIWMSLNYRIFYINFLFFQKPFGFVNTLQLFQIEKQLTGKSAYKKNQVYQIYLNYNVITAICRFFSPIQNKV